MWYHWLHSKTRIFGSAALAGANPRQDHQSGSPAEGLARASFGTESAWWHDDEGSALLRTLQECGSWSRAAAPTKPRPVAASTSALDRLKRRNARPKTAGIRQAGTATAVTRFPSSYGHRAQRTITSVNHAAQTLARPRCPCGCAGRRCEERRAVLSRRAGFCWCGMARLATDGVALLARRRGRSGTPVLCDNDYRLGLARVIS